ncbi:M48 family metalloprotease [Candidatus Latescibacterota bacterium]
MSVKKSICTILCLLIVFSAFAVSQDTPKSVKVVVKEAQGRSGPGSFYELKVLIPQDTVLDVIEMKKSWYKIKYADEIVWVSENSLSVESGASEKSGKTETSMNMDVFKSLSTETVTSPKASPAVLTAAIKGFWTRYTGADKQNLAELPVNGYDVPPGYVESFSDKRSREVSRDRLQRQFGISRRYRKSSLTYEKEHSIGYSIASSIAEGPLVENESLINYISAVGWYLAESTERYELQFKFYVLDTDRINAVSCPGGYIVLTRGLLELIADESELAALLAHEMSHVIAGHAMQSMEESEVGIKASSAFDLLGAETGETSAIEDDLLAITNRAVSIATSPKLDEQEFEADRMALTYMARSGYDVNGLTRMLNTMMTRHESNIDIFDLNYRNHPDFKERLQQIEREMRKYRRYEGKLFAADFRSNMTF